MSLTIPISASSKEQRIGRIGRNYDGYAFMLYKEDTKFYNDPNPIIYPNKLTPALLMRII